MNNAIVCIAKNEDRYIDEWLHYHLKLGFNKIFVYQNDWRYAGDKAQYGDSVEWIEFDGNCMQLSAYNNFIDTKSTGYDFAGFIDCDEYLCLRLDTNLDGFFNRYVDCYAIGINWRLFGDNGLTTVSDEDRSLLKRFTRCQKSMNKHIKTFLNLKKCQKKFHFINPHFVDAAIFNNVTVDPSKKIFIKGPFNCNGSNEIAQLNHYHCKTRQEYLTRNARGRADVKVFTDNVAYSNKKFDEHNFNEVEDTAALDFYSSSVEKRQPS